MVCFADAQIQQFIMLKWPGKISLCISSKLHAAHFRPAS